MTSAARGKTASRLLALLLPAVVLLAALPAHAQDTRDRPFDQGKMRFGLVAGGGSNGNNTYFVIGGSGSYFVLPGLAVGAEVTHWFDEVAVTKLSPGITYVLDFGGQVAPYAGVFYRRWFVYGGDDLDTAGMRGGINWLVGKHAFLSLGLGYETILSSCSGTCDFSYPELSLSISM